MLRIFYAFLAAFFAFVFQACSNLEKKNLIPTANSEDLAQTKRLERKIQNTRKSEIRKGKFTHFSAFATYLNEVDNIEGQRDVFLVELYEKNQNVKIEDDLDFVLISAHYNFEALFITQLQPDQYTDILKPKNIYNKIFIVEFDEIPKSHRENMKLKMIVKNQGEMLFDFSYPTLKSKLK